MSKVKIQGNASGTGVVTLTAPNTNTDRTITLPDETVSLTGAPAGLDDVGGVARATSGLLFNADTAAANALDDYEEGTWTPSFASTSITIDQAKYVKIGNMVNVMCYITIHSALTSNQFGGFPYASSQYYASSIGYGGSNFIGLGIYSGDDGAGGRFSSGLPSGTGNFMFNHWYKTT